VVVGTVRTIMIVFFGQLSRAERITWIYNERRYGHR
jgi:hypothetical protein